MEISKTFHFESSHILHKHLGKCARLHGHSWVLKVTVSGPVDEETGFVMDYADLSGAVQAVVDKLDHRHLGSWRAPLFKFCEVLSISYNCVKDLPLDFYPSSENLIMWIGEHLTQGGYNVGWSKLELNETCTSSCMLTREEYERTVGNASGRISEKK